MGENKGWSGLLRCCRVRSLHVLNPKNNQSLFPTKIIYSTGKMPCRECYRYRVRVCLYYVYQLCTCTCFVCLQPMAVAFPFRTIRGSVTPGLENVTDHVIPLRLKNTPHLGNHQCLFCLGGHHGRRSRYIVCAAGRKASTPHHKNGRSTLCLYCDHPTR